MLSFRKEKKKMIFCQLTTVSEEYDERSMWKDSTPMNSLYNLNQNWFFDVSYFSTLFSQSQQAECIRKVSVWKVFSFYTNR